LGLSEVDHYSPFDNSLRQLSPADLTVLTSVREGWYVEYKSQTVNASSVAKSISAFANTYGGWLFYGIKEKSKDDSVAGLFLGIDCADLDAFQQSIRQATATLVTPSPHFDLTILRGPCAEIGLGNGRAVICLQIPRSLNTPHIHKSGQIYRRVSDGSEPKPENDRFILDQLWQRADKFKRGYRKWVKRAPELAKGESEWPFVRLLIVPDLWAEHNIQIDFDVDHIRDTINTSDGVGINIPFENIYTSAKGIVARQRTIDGPHSPALTWKLWPDLSGEILLPIARFEVSKIDRLPGELVGYHHSDRLRQILEDQHYEHTTVVDLNFLFYLLLGITKIQNRLCLEANWKGNWFMKARLLNVWRTTPFLDIPDALDRYEKYGVPMCLENDVTVPPGSDPETFGEISSFHHVELEEARCACQAQVMFGIIANAFGIPPSLVPYRENGDRTLYGELCSAGNRAIEAQRIRNARKHP
jgi:hypothetical protein